MDFIVLQLTLFFSHALADDMPNRNSTTFTLQLNFNEVKDIRTRIYD